MISSISSFDIIDVVCCVTSKGCAQPWDFLCIPVFASNAAVVNPSGTKTLLANDLSTFFFKSKPVFSNGPIHIPRNPPDCTILENRFFDTFILADELLVKALGTLETCLSVNNNLCGKNHKPILMKDLKLLYYHFLFLILTY